MFIVHNLIEISPLQFILIVNQIKNCKIMKGTFLLLPEPKNVITCTICTDLIENLDETLTGNATISEVSNSF